MLRIPGGPRAGPAAAIALALVLSVVLAACSGPAPPADSAVLITVDTWRADRFGAGGHPLVRTPHLDRFFRRGTQFPEAFSPIPTTLASHVSLLSGAWPAEHGVPRNGWPVPEEVVTLPEILAAEGFRTGAFVSSAALDPAFGLDRGFDVYDYAPAVEVERDQSWRPAARTLEPAIRWWRSTHGRRFLWVHLFEPHFPYTPDPQDLALYDTGYRGDADGSMDFLFAAWEDPSRLDPAARAHLEALYHAEITGLDRSLGRFLEELAGEKRTLVIVAADHGESLGEHGLDFKHGPHVFPADVRVPLLARGVPPFGPGVSASLVRTVDVARTILGRLGVSADLPDDAGDLADWAAGGEGLPVFAEASMPWNVEVRGAYVNAYKQRSARTPAWAIVKTPWRNETLWFDRRADPAELSPTAAPRDRDGRALEESLDSWIARGAARPAPATVDPRLIRQLQALGYVR